MKIATEEAFATQGLVDAWKKLLADGAPGEAGLDQHFSRIINASGGWGAQVTERLLDLGLLRHREPATQERDQTHQEGFT